MKLYCVYDKDEQYVIAFEALPKVAKYLGVPVETLAKHISRKIKDPNTKLESGMSCSRVMIAEDEEDVYFLRGCVSSCTDDMQDARRRKDWDAEERAKKQRARYTKKLNDLYEDKAL